VPSQESVIITSESQPSPRPAELEVKGFSMVGSSVLAGGGPLSSVSPAPLRPQTIAIDAASSRLTHDSFGDQGAATASRGGRALSD
jgi:hypothetical protein